jgi:hypothetical protein
MNAFNRVLVVFLLVLAMVLCSVLLVGSRRVIPAMVQQSSALLESIEGLPWYQLELPGGALACVVNLILFLFILLEVRQPRKSIRVEQAGGGKVLISIASIADRMKHEVGQLPDVLRTKPKVSSKRKGVGVELDVEAQPGINVPEKAEQIVETARRVVEEDMGLKLARPPKVNLRVASYSKAGISPIRPREVVPVAPKTTPPPEPKDLPTIEPGSWSPVEPVEAEVELPHMPEDLAENS